MKRRISNKKQVVTVIRNIVENMQNPQPDGKDKNNPITVSLFEVLLLTSKLGSIRESILFLIIKKDKYQSEYRQLKDSCLAMERLRYSEQPIAVKMKDGTITYVKYDTSYMNIPVNAGNFALKTYNNPLQKGINARGFVDYNGHARKFVNNIVNDLNVFVNDAKDLKKKNNNSLSSDEILKIKKFQNIENFTNFIDLSKAYINIESEQVRKQSLLFSIQLNETFLKLSAKDLNDKEAELQKELDKEVPDDKKINSLKEQYRKKEIEFSSRLKDNFSLYRQLNELEKRNYMWKGKGLADGLHKQIKEVLAALPANANDDDSEQKKVRELALFMQNHLVCEDMFYNEKYQDEHNTYKFQAHLLINNRAMGREIAVSCKSSEDRTGWQRIILAAYVVFIELYGHAPQFEQIEDKRNFDTIIIQKIHEMSASLENTKYNSEARGLQISAQYTDQRIGVEIGDKSGKLAKGIFNHLAGYEPSAEVKKAWNELLNNAQPSKTSDKVDKTVKTTKKGVTEIFNKISDKMSAKKNVTEFFNKMNIAGFSPVTKTKPNPPNPVKSSTKGINEDDHPTRHK